MKPGLIASIIELRKLPESAQRNDCILAVVRLLNEYHKTIQISYEPKLELWYAVRGNFAGFAVSPFGCGETSQGATQDLLNKERNEIC